MLDAVADDVPDCVCDGEAVRVGVADPVAELDGEDVPEAVADDEAVWDGVLVPDGVDVREPVSVAVGDSVLLGVFVWVDDPDADEDWDGVRDAVAVGDVDEVALSSGVIVAVWDPE